MKNAYKLLLLFFLFASLTNTTAQQTDWSLPAAFEISENDKTDAWLGQAGNFGPLIMWEEKTDDNSTAIMYHRYLTNSPPVVLLSEAGVHFRNPQCRNTPYNSIDTTFLVFYEREQNGKTEIYYLKCTNDGSHSNPLPIALEGTHNHELALAPWQDSRFIAWNADGNILASERIVENGIFSFGEPDTIDMQDCSQPCMNMESSLCWVNKTRGTDKIYNSHYVYPGYWTSPEQVFEGEEINQVISGSESLFSAVFSWTFLEDGIWKVANSNAWETEFLEFTSDEPFDFGVYSMDIIFDKNEKWWGDYFFACAKNDGQFDEIFLYSNLYGSNLDQFSFLESQCRNPKFYTGETGPHGWWTYLIWETLANGHWQLYYSKAYFVYGAIEENDFSQNIQISPNPARDFIQIKNKTEMDISIVIFDNTGKRVYQDSFNDVEKKIETGNWSRGIYFVRISDDERNFTQKLILN